jgi:hypothetical protein
MDVSLDVGSFTGSIDSCNLNVVKVATLQGTFNSCAIEV